MRWMECSEWVSECQWVSEWEQGSKWACATIYYKHVRDLGLRPVKKDLTGMRPVKEDLTGMRPVKEDLTGMRPVKEDLTGMRPVKEDRTGMRPVKEDLTGMRPVKEDRTGMRPVKEDRINDPAIYLCTTNTPEAVVSWLSLTKTTPPPESVHIIWPGNNSHEVAQCSGFREKKYLIFILNVWYLWYKQ